MTDLFDTVGAGDTTPTPGPAEPETATEETNQLLATEAGGEPEEMTGTENEADDTTGGNGEDEATEAEKDETPATTGAPTPTAAQPTVKQVNVVEEDLYDFNKCLISVALGMLPNDGNPDGRLVMLGVRNHQDEPIFTTCRMNELTPLPDPIQQLLEQLKEQLPARSEKAARKKAKAKAEEEKRKAAISKTKPAAAKAVPQKVEKPKPTSMNLFDMFDQKG